MEGCRKTDITANSLKSGSKYKCKFHDKSTSLLIEYIDDYYILTNSRAYSNDNNKYSSIKELHAALTDFYPFQ